MEKGTQEVVDEARTKVYLALLLTILTMIGVILKKTGL
jgi:hypothetical protein